MLSCRYESYENSGDLAQSVAAHSFPRRRWGYMLRMARTHMAQDLTRRGQISANYWLYIAHAETDSFHSIKSQRSTYHLLSISCRLILPARPCLSLKNLSRERHLSLSSSPAASNTLQYRYRYHTLLRDLCIDSHRCKPSPKLQTRQQPDKQLPPGVDTDSYALVSRHLPLVRYQG